MVPKSSTPLLIAPISAAAPGPLYLQIINSLKREISEGRLPGGSALPSFRRLAGDLLVSVITVKRAYEELEREGERQPDGADGPGIAHRGRSDPRHHEPGGTHDDQPEQDGADHMSGPLPDPRDQQRLPQGAVEDREQQDRAPRDDRARHHDGYGVRVIRVRRIPGSGGRTRQGCTCAPA